MNVRFLLSAALLSCAGAALAQSETPASETPTTTAPTSPPAASAGEAAVQQSAMAFGQCIQAGITGVAATVTPEAGATSVLGGCATQRGQLEQAVMAMIDGLPEDRKAAARQQFASHMAQAETQIAAVIRQQRSAATTPAQ